MTATMKDIAAVAGVSTATVSYVINGSRRVSPELSARVQRAVRELGYTPNAVAQSLRHARTRSIGLLVPDNSNPFFAELAKGVEDEAFERGYSVLLCNSNSSHEREARYLELLLAKQIDGLLYSPTTGSISDVAPFLARQVPVVTFYRDPGVLPVDAVRVDNARMGYVATSHLLELGHRRIAFIEPAADGASSQRVLGYREALRQAGILEDPALIVRGDNRFEGGGAAVRELLATGVAFTGLVAANDATALGAMGTLQHAGLGIPADISIVGIDDIRQASFWTPSLTTVSQPKYEAGQQALAFLVERIEGDKTPPRRIVLETHLVVRASTAPPPRTQEKQ
jgi:LacI family transcriptional regulator